MRPDGPFYGQLVGGTCHRSASRQMYFCGSWAFLLLDGFVLRPVSAGDSSSKGSKSCANFEKKATSPFWRTSLCPTMCGRHSHRLIANLTFPGMIHHRRCPKEASQTRFQIWQVLVPSPMPLGRFRNLLALPDHHQQTGKRANASSC